MTDLRFQDEQAAARYLLGDASARLAEYNVKFVIVGGWAPFLLHSKKYGHPGTFDVDALIDSSSLTDGSFEQATESMLAGGYLRAAKNVFQLHRVLDVAGEGMVFHVDFLNERDQGGLIDPVSGTGRVRSIYTPTMKAVFAHGRLRTPADEDLKSVRFPSPETFIVTKAPALRVSKRMRDAFDIFVTAADQSRTQFSRRWHELVDTDGLFRDGNDDLWKALYEGDAIEKVREVLRRLGRTLAEKEILACFGFVKPPVDDGTVGG